MADASGPRSTGPYGPARDLAARFGGDTLSDDAARDYEKRVREIRTYKPPPPTVVSGP